MLYFHGRGVLPILDKLKISAEDGDFDVICVTENVFVRKIAKYIQLSIYRYFYAEMIRLSWW